MRLYQWILPNVMVGIAFLTCLGCMVSFAVAERPLPDLVKNILWHTLAWFWQTLLGGTKAPGKPNPRRRSSSANKLRGTVECIGKYTLLCQATIRFLNSPAARTRAFANGAGYCATLGNTITGAWGRAHEHVQPHVAFAIKDKRGVTTVTVGEN
jgi:hypothetical protein